MSGKRASTITMLAIMQHVNMASVGRARPAVYLGGCLMQWQCMGTWTRVMLERGMCSGAPCMR